MAESMKGLHRSHRCTEVSNENIGQEVTVMGWVQKRRNLGSLIFIDLRDRSGILQLVFDDSTSDEEVLKKANELFALKEMSKVKIIDRRSEISIMSEINLLSNLHQSICILHFKIFIIYI